MWAMKGDSHCVGVVVVDIESAPVIGRRGRAATLQTGHSIVKQALNLIHKIGRRGGYRVEEHRTCFKN